MLFLTRDETADTLRLSLRTVDSLIAKKQIAVRRIGRRVLIPSDELERFVAQAQIIGGEGHA